MTCGSSLFQDDPVLASNLAGTITYATAGGILNCHSLRAFRCCCCCCCCCWSSGIVRSFLIVVLRLRCVSLSLLPSFSFRSKYAHNTAVHQLQKQQFPGLTGVRPHRSVCCGWYRFALPCSLLLPSSLSPFVPHSLRLDLGSVISGMEVAEAIFNPTPTSTAGVNQNQYTKKGNEWIRSEYPNINFIVNATIRE